MNVKRFLAMSLVAATCAISVSEVSAQGLSGNAGPAEIPPASFKGSQYVDSKGCVYIRAGVDGNVSWVPRVSRSRKLVCGLSPSIAAGSGTAVAAAPKPKPPVEIGTNTVTSPKSPPAQTATPVIRPARKTVAEALAPNPVKTVASKPAVRRQAPVVKPAPKKIVRTAPLVRQAQPRVVRATPRVAPVAVQPQRVVVQSNRTNAQTCQGASAVSQRYIGGRGAAVRCGPQTVPFQHTRSGGTVAAAARAPATINGSIYRNRAGQVLNNVSPNARIVPLHVYNQQQAARIASPTPDGYRKVWQDDRLNTKRAHQTRAGKERTEVVWSNTVPRRLIVRSTGRDVTRSFPGLRYPFTSLAQQAAAGVQPAQTGTAVVSSKGTVAKRTVRKQPAQVKTRVQTPRKPAQVAGKKFVQVGTFGVASNAQNTANRLQRMGLPVRIGKFTRGGKQMRIVLAGPFASPAHTSGALTALRNAGFRDAFARN